MRKFMIEAGWHRQEVRFYLEVLPLLQTFVDENAAEPYRIPVPRCLGSAHSTTLTRGLQLPPTGDVIVLQNLKADKNRKWFQFPLELGLGEEALLVVLKALAKIHAVPLAMRARVGARKVAKVIPGWTDASCGPEVLAKHLADGYRNLEAFLKEKRPSWTPGGQDWVNLQTMVTFGCRGNKPCSRLETVCHADIWNGNLMFSGSNDSVDAPSDCLVLDWQLCSACSPAIDVCDVLQFCTHFKGEDGIARILRVYWDELTSVLQSYTVSLENDLQICWGDFLSEVPIATALAGVNWLCSMEMMFAHKCPDVYARVLSWYDYFSGKDWGAILAETANHD